MDRTTLNTRLERIQNEISKLVNTLYALNLTDSDTYPQNYEELSTDAALRAEKIACTLRNLIYSANLVPKPILMQKAARSGLDMPEDVAVTIAKRLKSNVRELEGAVQQVLAYTNFHDVDVTIDTVKVALRDIFKVSAVPVTIDNISRPWRGKTTSNTPI